MTDVFMEARVCLVCGNAFIATYKKQKVCKNPCAYKDIYKMPPKPPKLPELPYQPVHATRFRNGQTTYWSIK